MLTLTERLAEQARTWDSFAENARVESARLKIQRDGVAAQRFNAITLEQSPTSAPENLASDNAANQRIFEAQRAQEVAYLNRQIEDKESEFAHWAAKAESARAGFFLHDPQSPLDVNLTGIVGELFQAAVAATRVRYVGAQGVFGLQPGASPAPTYIPGGMPQAQ